LYDDLAGMCAAVFFGVDAAGFAAGRAGAFFAVLRAWFFWATSPVLLLRIEATSWSAVLSLLVMRGSPLP
jgi:TM2 domain-containing membrane protein YozV